MMALTTFEMLKRPRRNRLTPSIRQLAQEHTLCAGDFVAPLFLIPGDKRREQIEAMPGIERHSVDFLVKEAEILHAQGIPAVDLFPSIDPFAKDHEGSEAWNPNGLVPTAIRLLKREVPSLCVIADIALDPYTSHGHDGIPNEFHEIENDLTLEALIRQSLIYAEAGADILAPSDMMDGRVKFIREALDVQGFQNVGILSYCAKYASAFYGPFRNAIQTSLSFGDKKTYQMDPANVREAIREAILDEEEGADMLMVKPALPYLDVIAKIKEKTTLPVGAYHVSGEYAMIMAAHERGWLDAQKTFYESLIGIKRAGADFIFTYAINQILDLLN
jgi:porphobilinogen synthase